MTSKFLFVCLVILPFLIGAQPVEEDHGTRQQKLVGKNMNFGLKLEFGLKLDFGLNSDFDLKWGLI